MSKILIDILPAKGHFHATLKLASLLKDQNYEIVYGSHISLKPEVIRFENIPMLQKIHKVDSCYFAKKLSTSERTIYRILKTLKETEGLKIRYLRHGKIYYLELE